jgi:catechol 2,3-dioxygenase-like lactoylglutathione lyase family enzyme
MINHISIGVRDLARAKRFYEAALAPLGYRCLSESEDALGYGRGSVALWIGAAERPVPADAKRRLVQCVRQRLPLAPFTNASLDQLTGAAVRDESRARALSPRSN